MLDRSKSPAKPLRFFFSLLCGDKLGDVEDIEGRLKDGIVRDFLAVKKNPKQVKNKVC